MAKVPMTRWNLFLPAHLIAEIKEVADEREVSASQVVRVAVRKYIEAVRKAPRSPQETTSHPTEG